LYTDIWFVSDIAAFVLKRDVKLHPANQQTFGVICRERCAH